MYAQVKTKSKKEEHEKVQERLDKHKEKFNFAQRDAERDTSKVEADWETYKVLHLR